jgi:hypothetical protein
MDGFRLIAIEEEGGLYASNSNPSPGQTAQLRGVVLAQVQQSHFVSAAGVRLILVPMEMGWIDVYSCQNNANASLGSLEHEDTRILLGNTQRGTSMTCMARAPRAPRASRIESGEQRPVET